MPGTMTYRNPLMLLRLAQGDAYGFGVEYIKPTHAELAAEALKLEHYVQNPFLDVDAGCYTDDTQMSIANAQVLLTMRPPYKPIYFANAYVDAFRASPRLGYSRSFYPLIASVRSGQELLDRIIPDSDKNGAAMRAVPLGVLSSVDEVLDVAEVQARITHDSFAGVISAQAVALMSHYAMYEEGPMREGLPVFLCKHLPKFTIVRERLSDWHGPVEGPDVGLKTAVAVLRLLSSELGLLEMMRKIIEVGGDTDTVAALAWGIAAARSDEDLPVFFEADLEQGGAFGAAYLRDLGIRLMGGFSRPAFMVSYNHVVDMLVSMRDHPGAWAQNRHSLYAQVNAVLAAIGLKNRPEGPLPLKTGLVGENLVFDYPAGAPSSDFARTLVREALAVLEGAAVQ